MRYIKENHTSTSITKICTLLFQICVIADAVLGLDPRFYVLSKGCMFAFFVMVIIHLLWNGNVRFGKAFVLPVLFMTINALSCLWADYPSATIYRLKTQVQLYVLCFFSYIVFTNNKIDVKKYLDALYISGIGMAAYAIYKYGFSGIIQGLYSGIRLGGEITNENVFGMIFSKASLIAYYYYIKSTNKKYRIAHICLVFLFTLFAFSSGSKKAFLMILVGVLGINLLENGISKMWKSLIISAVVIVGLIAILQLPVFSKMNERIMLFFNGEKDSSDLMRTKMIDLSIELIYEKPIFGHGFNNFSAITGLGTYSHNNMTEVLVSTGVVGFIIFYAQYIPILQWGWIMGVKKKNHIPTLLFILSILYLVFGYAMVEYYDKGYWILTGVLISCVDNYYLSERNKAYA